MGWRIDKRAQIQKMLKDEGVSAPWSAQSDDFFNWLNCEKWKISFCALQGVRTTSPFKFFYEFLDLGFPFNAPAHYRSPIFKYTVALSINIQLEI